MIPDYCCSAMSFGLQVLYDLSVSPIHASRVGHVDTGGSCCYMISSS